MEGLLVGLNEAQRDAVTSAASVLQVLAPPGSGKTKTLTARVAYLINERRLRPWNIIVCTFTVKAAREMKDRIKSLVGDGLESKLILGTFHSVARRFLVSYGSRIGIEKNFGIADSSDSLAIIKRIVKRGNYDVEPGAARSRISGLKAKRITADQHAAAQKSTEQQEFAGIYFEYQESLQASGLLDYDDLLLKCTELLDEHPECVSNIEAVLIDEFQDTNNVQFELMRLFAQHKHNVTIVGDPDQSIYGFRSAEIENLNRMKVLYPETVRINLEKNYRSSGSILMTALEVIEQDTARPAKALLASHCVGERPVLRKLPSAAAEASWLVAEIKRSCSMTGGLLQHGDFAVLLRSAALSRHIESALGREGIPYRMVGGHRFFDRVEVKVVLDYLRVINQPEHNDALVRVINVPSRKIGEVTVKALIEEAEVKKVALWSLVQGTAQGRIRPTTKISAQAMKGLEQFINIILTCQKKRSSFASSNISLVDLIATLMQKISFEDYLRKEYKDEFDGRWANVEELVAQANDTSTALANGQSVVDESLPAIEGVDRAEFDIAEDALGAFLANVALSTETKKDQSEETIPQVTISTIHAAKGLEWPVVFIPATYEGSIPHSRAEDTDEERRLLYVGMTRAQSMLFMSCPVKNSQREETTLSQFLSKEVQRLLEIKGPSYGFSVVQDLARILGRPCPSQSTLDAACSSVEYKEDNYWPLDGSEVDPETRYWRNSNPNSDCFEHLNKRRRVDNKTPVPGLSVSISMHEQNYSASSTTLSAGFVSAASRMKEIEEMQAEEAEEAKRKTTNSRMIGVYKKTETEPKQKSKKQGATQGSIASFFRKPGSSEPLATFGGHDAQALPTPSMGHATQVYTKSTTSAAHVEPLDDITNTMRAIPRTITSFSKTTSTVSRSLHRPTVRPQTASTLAEQHPEAYVLLSSSPVHPEEDVDADNDVEAAEEDMVPAATFHTTSVTQLSYSSRPKALGMRRNVQGWSARPFAPPKRPG